MRNGKSFAADEAETKGIYKRNHHKKGTTGIRNLNGNMTAKNKNKNTAWINNSQENHNFHLYPREGNRETLDISRGKKKNQVMSVLCADVWCWARCSHVVLCSYDSRGGSRFTYCMLTNREEDICCSSSTTRHSIQLIPHSYPLPLLGETTRQLRSHSWF